MRALRQIARALLQLYTFDTQSHMTNVPTSKPVLRQRMPELDTLRGIAILLVLIYHGFAPAQGTVAFHGVARAFLEFAAIGWIGVGCFFVLSGFLITGILLDSKDRRDFFRRFYIRRALRILPIYVAVLLVLAILTAVHWSPAGESWRYLGLSLLFLSNVAVIFRIPTTYGVLWSLAVEEHFYMMWPAAARYLSRRGVAVVAVTICIICPALRAASFMIGKGMGWTDYGAYTWLVADSLGTGALLAAALRSPGASRRTSWRFLSGAYAASAALILFGARYGILSRSTLIGMTLRQSALNLFFLGFLASFLLIGSSRWEAWVFISPLQFLGAISYGVYLIHSIVFGVLDRVAPLFYPQFLQAAGTQLSWMTLRFCIAVGGSLILAYWSRWHFEEFFLRLKERA